MAESRVKSANEWLIDLGSSTAIALRVVGVGSCMYEVPGLREYLNFIGPAPGKGSVSVSR